MQTNYSDQFKKILQNELVKALGCTEPIAIAYISARARQVLGADPERIEIECSGNMIKNAKSVTVPMTDSLKGIEAACIIGAIGGDPDRNLEVLSTVTEDHVKRAKQMIADKVCKLSYLETPEKLHIIVHMYAGTDVVIAELKATHTGITSITKNGKSVYEKEVDGEDVSDIDYSCLNVANILDYANHVDLDDVKGLIEEQIKCNSAISQEGLTHDWGLKTGQMLLKNYGDDIKVRARAVAAAGSDARMSGCEMPVIINSGSGNQGMTVSLPVIEYAKYLKSDHEKLIRALVLSNLIAIYQKFKIGRLSAYCGVVSAAAGAGAGITYLYDGSEKQIEDTVTNTLANVSGIVCDGAGTSCAAKIASSLDAAIMASILAREGEVYAPGDGIVKEDLQHTIDGVVKLAKDGMKTTDDVILHIMIND